MQWIGEEIFLFTGGSLNTEGEEPAGILLVGLSLSDLVNQLERAVLSSVTIYSFNGELLTSTIGQADLDGMALLEQTAVSVIQEQNQQMFLRTITPAGDEFGQLTRSFNHMVTQLKQRRYIEDMFGRYVGDDIAQQIIEGKATLGGNLVHASVLFADIRDFTTYTENTELPLLLDELNEYYELMQEAIERNGGIVNKFGGDSILALFGAPIPDDDHAQHAVAAAYEMMDQLVLLNQRRRERRAVPFRIGIGVNSGEMIVGNLGSERRREYTVLGDTVNTASRMSDLNKNTPIHTVFVSQQTKQQLINSPFGERLDDLGEVKVKGREVPVHIHALIHGQ